MELALAYDHRTSLARTRGAAALDFAVDLFRRPVAFRGRVKDPVLLRQLLLALHEGILSDARWHDPDVQRRTLDPVITVHPDQLIFEAFSDDQSSYLRVAAPLAAFEPEGEVAYGTTNIDFNPGLRRALDGLRSSRRTLFRVGAGGFGISTAVGAGSQDHYQRKVDVPDEWVKGFMQVQGALAMRPFVFDARPADLLTAIAYLQDNKPPRPPHGLRFEFQPDAPIAIALEPWERRFTLRGTHYTGYPRTVRLWGRKRLGLLTRVLPYAQRVTIGVLGRGLPHSYTCSCGPYQFTLVLSGWSANDWSRDAAFDLLAPRAMPNPQRANQVYAYLSEHLAARAGDIANNTGVPRREVEQALFQLCRAGRAMADPTTEKYRLRELFATPLDIDTLFAPDPRQATAQRLFNTGQVTLNSVLAPAENVEHPKETRAEATVMDEQTYAVIVAVDDGGRLRFGHCGCRFFQDNLMSRGPCVHIMAARLAVDALAAAKPNAAAS